MQKSKVLNTNHTNSPLTSFDKVAKYFKFSVDTYIYLANGSRLQPLHSITYNRRATVSPKDKSFQLGITTEFWASHEGLLTPLFFPWAVPTFSFVRSCLHCDARLDTRSQPLSKFFSATASPMQIMQLTRQTNKHGIKFQGKNDNLWICWYKSPYEILPLDKA